MWTSTVLFLSFSNALGIEVKCYVASGCEIDKLKGIWKVTTVA
jgi:hypothetical protein